MLFITYTLLKKYLKRSVLVKMIMPSTSDNSNESNILLELNSGFDSVLLYVCTIKGQLHEFSLNSNVAMETTVLTNQWFIILQFTIIILSCMDIIHMLISVFILVILDFYQMDQVVSFFF